MLSLHAQFGVGECFSTGDEMGVFLLVGEVVVVVMGVVNIVGVVATQGEHSEECNIEEGTLAEVVGEVVVRRVAEKETEEVQVLELVGGEAAFGDKRLKGLLMGLQCRTVLHTHFWQPLPRCLFFFLNLSRFPCFHGHPCCFFSFSFLSMWVILGILVSLMLLLFLLLLGSVVLFWLLELRLPLLIVLLLLLLVQDPWFVFEEGMQLDFFPLFGGSPPLPGHLRPALLVICFGLALTWVLGLRCLTDGGGGC